ncbi:MAG TPA: HD domain-containing phosphohydrolase [bacterium]|nr:HD domain-containing phosphohydrolase [bacterium]
MKLRVALSAQNVEWAPLLLRFAAVAAGAFFILRDPAASLDPTPLRVGVAPAISAMALAGLALTGVILAVAPRVTILGSSPDEVLLPFDLILVSLLVRSTSPETSVFYFYFPLVLAWSTVGVGIWHGTVAGVLAAAVFAIVAGPSVVPTAVVYGALILPLFGAVAGAAQWTRRRRLNDQLRRAHTAQEQLRRMQRAQTAVAAMAPLQLRARVEGFLDLVVDLTEADVAAAALLDEEGAPIVRGVRHLEQEEWEARRFPPEEGLAKRVLTEGAPLTTEDAGADPLWTAVFNGAGIRAAAAVPLRIQSQVIGFTLVGRRNGGRFRPDDLASLTLVADESAIILHDGQVQEQLRELLYSAVRTLVAALEAKDPYTRGHSQRVASAAVAIATELGLSAQEVEHIRLAGLLHDIGKIATPEDILRKMGPLTPEERAVVNQHAERGAAILAEMRPFRPLAELVLSHQESYDGSGYPDGLAGDAIPIGARIIRVADAFDAITSDRPYRRRKPLPQATDELRQMAGRVLDPEVVETFLRVLATKPPFDIQLRMWRERS